MPKSTAPKSTINATKHERSQVVFPLRRRQTRDHLLVLALYTLLTLILTWPLVMRLTTHVPGVAQWAFDESTFLWNIWYFKHSLVDQLRSPLHSELIWYPLGIDLVLYTYNFFHALLAQPLMLAVNLPFASNIALLLSTILSGYGTFLLVNYELGIRITNHETRNTQRATRITREPSERELRIMPPLQPARSMRLPATAPSMPRWATMIW